MLANLATAKDDWQQGNYGQGADASATAQASADTPWWQDTWNQDNTGPVHGGSNFDVHVAEDSTPHLPGLPRPAPWNVATATGQPSTWQEYAQAPHRSCATNSVTQSGGGRTFQHYDDPWA